MKLNEAWEKEWEGIQVPQDKVFAAIEAGLKPTKKQKRFNFSYKKIIVLAASLILIATGAYVFLNNQPQQNLSSSSTADMKMESADGSSVAEAPANLAKGEKIVKNYYISKETNQLDVSIAEIEKALSEVDGYLSRSQIEHQTTQNNNRLAYLTLRVPIEQIETFLGKLEKIGVTTQSEVNTDDLTLGYVDNASRITALETEEKALLALMDKEAEVADLISIQERLAVVRGEKESLIATNKIIDNQSEEATIELTIAEVSQFTQEGNTLSVGAKIKQNFKKQGAFWGVAWKEIIVFLVSVGPYLLVLGGLIATGIWFRKRIKNKQR